MCYALYIPLYYSVPFLTLNKELERNQTMCNFLKLGFTIFCVCETNSGGELIYLKWKVIYLKFKWGFNRTLSVCLHYFFIPNACSPNAFSPKLHLSWPGNRKYTYPDQYMYRRFSCRYFMTSYVLVGKHAFKENVFGGNMHSG